MGFLFPTSKEVTEKEKHELIVFFYFCTFVHFISFSALSTKKKSNDCGLCEVARWMMIFLMTGRNVWCALLLVLLW